MTRERLACGCSHDGALWREQCPAHRAEHDALHAAHAAAMAARRVAEDAPGQAQQDIALGKVAAHDGAATS